ncbi:hypothetical protein Acsp04_43910 [Actinomadura sp. NBRC 104425]|uniref:hypothetical protein n=1 Tax=Actinomadura sp. NBRC 104425 TaxID=3032204 RepID=UPI0024A3024B|nr:hypothetical protein [Actinomadura sp. NBRC 104425]GLZ14156.1 hypothetical protein Acsp04_43910 [Actinomadura sp. NBRC 104425]
MNTAIKLGAFALGLAAVFGGAAGVGAAVGPIDATAGTHKTGSTGRHGPNTSSHVPAGLQVSQDGYTLTPETTTITPGERTDFRFSVTGPDGRPVTRFEPLHGKPLHLIVARRDLSGFQHLHPTEAGGGVWTVPLTLPEPGPYRFFTDFKAAGASGQLTLGTDVTAPGDYRPRAAPPAGQVAKVDGYEVKPTGTLVPGRSSRLTLSVSRDGRPVTDLEPYLEAYGHLVVLRDRDLAYLHVHPDGAPGDGRTRPGPDATFEVEVPSPGRYRLYLDFQHAGKVRTAEFTAVADNTAPPTAPAQDGGDDGHDHGH